MNLLELSLGVVIVAAVVAGLANLSTAAWAQHADRTVMQAIIERVRDCHTWPIPGSEQPSNNPTALQNCVARDGTEVRENWELTYNNQGWPELHVTNPTPQESAQLSRLGAIGDDNRLALAMPPPRPVAPPRYRELLMLVVPRQEEQDEE